MMHPEYQIQAYRFWCGHYVLSTWDRESEYLASTHAEKIMTLNPEVIHCGSELIL